MSKRTYSESQTTHNTIAENWCNAAKANVKEKANEKRKKPALDLVTLRNRYTSIAYLFGQNDKVTQREIIRKFNTDIPEDNFGYVYWAHDEEDEDYNTGNFYNSSIKISRTNNINKMIHQNLCKIRQDGCVWNSSEMSMVSNHKKVEQILLLVLRYTNVNKYKNSKNQRNWFNLDYTPIREEWIKTIIYNIQRAVNAEKIHLTTAYDITNM